MKVNCRMPSLINQKVEIFINKIGYQLFFESEDLKGKGSNTNLGGGLNDSKKKLTMQMRSRLQILVMMLPGMIWLERF